MDNLTAKNMILSCYGKMTYFLILTAQFTSVQVFQEVFLLLGKFAQKVNRQRA